MIRLFLKSTLCRNGFHFWFDRMNENEAWHECYFCGWQIEFSKEEYEALKSLQRSLK